MQVHKTVVESVMGENEIMEKNILNVVKGMKDTFWLNFINRCSGLSQEEIVEKVLEYFRSNRDSLCNIKYTVRSRGHNFIYHPLHLAIIFKRTEIVDVLCHHMKEDREFTRLVLNLRVLDVNKDVKTSQALEDKENRRY